MAQRNMIKTIDNTHESIPAAYDLNAQEIGDLLTPMQKAFLTKEERNQLFKIISNAFVYGFALGSRATVAGKVTKKL